MDGIDVMEGNSFYEMLTGKLMVELINPSWLIFSHGFRKIPAAPDFQAHGRPRLLVAAVRGSCSPPFLISWRSAIRLDSPGPYFFSQMRVGERGRIY